MKITSMFSQIETAVTATRSRVKGWPSVSRSASIAPLWIFKAKSAALLTLIGCIVSAFTSFAADPYLVRTFEDNGRLIDEIHVPPSPPPAVNASRNGA